MQDKEDQRPPQDGSSTSSTISGLRGAVEDFVSARQNEADGDADRKAPGGQFTVGTRWLRILWNVSVVVVVSVYISTFSQYDSKATLFPRLVGYPVLILALVSLVLEVVQSIKRGKRQSDVSQRERISLPNLFVALIFGVVYFFLWTPLGFELDSVVIMIVAPLVLGYPLRRVFILAVIGFLMAGLFTYLFGLGSGAILPLGYFNIRWP